jgi:pimeloyl-ACP methyl ester carboxylesterase
MSTSTARNLSHVRSADGTRIGVERVGSGDPMVLVHGGTADRTRWEPIVDRLAERFELHLMDRRGRGESRDDAPDYDITREAGDVAAVLDTIGAPALVVAHSYGATCVLAGIDHIAAAASGLVLYEPAFATIGHVAVDEAVIERWEDLLAADQREEALTLFYRAVIGLPDSTIDQMRGTAIWHARIAAMHTVLREAKAANSFRPAPSTAARTAPVRILVGEQTQPWLAAAAQAAHRALDGSDLEQIPGQGHVAMDTAPDQFIDVIRKVHDQITSRMTRTVDGTRER